MNSMHNRYAFLKKSLRSIHLLVFTLFIPIIFSSCNPVSSEEIQPSSREYTWKSYYLNNTSNNNQRYMNIGGSNANDIWIVSVLAGIYNYYYYNFNNSENLKLLPSSSNTIYDVCYTAKGSNITWFHDFDDNIYKALNGNISFFQSLNAYPTINQIISFFGESDTNLVAVGIQSHLGNFKGCIWALENGKWVTKDTSKVSFSYFKEIGRGLKSNGSTYFIKADVRTDSGIYNAIYTYDGIKIKTIFYESFSPSNISKLLCINDKIYFFFDKKLHTYLNNKFNVILDFSRYDILSFEIYGRSLNDLFMASLEGIYHFNGIDTKLVYTFPIKGQIRDAHILNKDVFFLIDNINFLGKPQTEFIHGSLK